MNFPSSVAKARLSGLCFQRKVYLWGQKGNVQGCEFQCRVLKPRFGTLRFPLESDNEFARSRAYMHPNLLFRTGLPISISLSTLSGTIKPPTVHCLSVEHDTCFCQRGSRFRNAIESEKPISFFCFSRRTNRQMNGTS